MYLAEGAMKTRPHPIPISRIYKNSTHYILFLILIKNHDFVVCFFIILNQKFITDTVKMTLHDSHVTCTVEGFCSMSTVKR